MFIFVVVPSMKRGKPIKELENPNFVKLGFSLERMILAIFP